MSLFQVFHNLKNITGKNVFKVMNVGSIVDFYFEADGNYGNLSGWKSYKMLCTMKYDWSSVFENQGDYKYNFIPIKKENDKWIYDKYSDLKVVVPIANLVTGELHTCEIHDKRYVILEVRSKENEYYYHPTTNSEVSIHFELRDEKLDPEGKEYSKVFNGDNTCFINF